MAWAATRRGLEIRYSTSLANLAPCMHGGGGATTAALVQLLTSGGADPQVVRFPYMANELYSMGQWAKLARKRIDAYMRHLTHGSNSTEHRSLRWREVRRCRAVAEGLCCNPVLGWLYMPKYRDTGMQPETPLVVNRASATTCGRMTHSS
jgi:hypothetical protein